MCSCITRAMCCAMHCKAPTRPTARSSCREVKTKDLMHRVWAIIERDLRRFRRSPVLVIVSIIMPMVQLVVLGYAFGGKIKHLEVGVVDQDHGVPAIKLKEMFQAVAANARTFDIISYSDKAVAMRDLRNGKINGLLNIPP